MLYLTGFILSVLMFLTGCDGEECCNSQVDIQDRQKDTLGDTVQEVKPVPIISDVPLVCIVGETFSVNALDSYDNDGDVVSYQWTFENESSLERDPVFTCAHDGEQNLCLQVTDNDGLNDQNCTTILGVASQPQTIPPIAIITMEDGSIRDGKMKSIYLDCSKSYDPDFVDGDQNSSNDGKIVKATWNIYKTLDGKRQPLHTKDICHKWVGLNDDLDSIEVTLVVTDDDGETSSVTHVYDYTGDKLYQR